MKISEKALLSSLHRGEMHFIFLLHWWAGSWGCEEGANPVAVLGQWERKTAGLPVVQGLSFLEETPSVCWCVIHFKAFGSHLVVKMGGCSVVSTYAALALLFFLPAQPMQQHFFLLIFYFFFFFLKYLPVTEVLFSVWSVWSLISMSEALLLLSLSSKTLQMKREKSTKFSRFLH